MMTRREVIALFEVVKRNYFPRWDRAGEWRAEFADAERLRYATGYCDSKAKRVYLHDDVCSFRDSDYVAAFFIHEICHDVGAAHHIRPWTERMESAAQLAERRGEQGIADAVRNEAFSYSDLGVYREVTGLTDSPMGRPV